MNPIEMAELLESVRENGLDAVERSDLLNAAGMLRAQAEMIRSLNASLADADHWRVRHSIDSEARGKQTVEQFEKIKRLEADNTRLRTAFEKVTDLLLKPDGHDPDGSKFYARWNAAEQACRDVLCGGEE